MARSAAERSVSSLKEAGSGTTPEIFTPWPGLVPHVTYGSRSSALMVTSLSNTASSSVFSVFQYSTALSHISPSGACGRPFRYSKVTSSGAIMPARAPASMDMLQMVMRASIDSFLMASPRYSMTWPWPPPVPIFAMMARIISLAVTPFGSSPSMFTAMVLNGFRLRVCVAMTCSTSEVPMPMAIAPNAPWVEVCESPHTMVMPGWVRPSTGANAWTTPWSASPSGHRRTPKSLQFFSSVLSWSAEVSSGFGRSMSTVGVLWSSVAISWST